jgi:hypothetical protein
VTGCRVTGIVVGKVDGTVDGTEVSGAVLDGAELVGNDVTGALLGGWGVFGSGVEVGGVVLVLVLGPGSITRRNYYVTLYDCADHELDLTSESSVRGVLTS